MPIDNVSRTGLTRALFTADPHNPIVQVAHYTTLATSNKTSEQHTLLRELSRTPRLCTQVRSAMLSHDNAWVRNLMVARGDMDLDEIRALLESDDVEGTTVAAAFAYADRLDDDVLIAAAARTGDAVGTWKDALENLDKLSTRLVNHALTIVVDAIDPAIAALKRPDIASGVVADSESRMWRRMAAACSPGVTHDEIRAMLDDPNAQTTKKARAVRSRIDQLVEARPDLPADVIATLAQRYWEAGGNQQVPPWVFVATGRAHARAGTFKQELRRLPMAMAQGQEQLITLFDRMPDEEREKVVSAVLTTRDAATLKAHVLTWLEGWVSDPRKRENWLLANLPALTDHRGEPWMADYPRVLMCTYRDIRPGFPGEMLRTVRAESLREWLTVEQLDAFTQVAVEDLVNHPDRWANGWIEIERLHPLTSEQLARLGMRQLSNGLSTLSAEERIVIGPRLAPLFAGVLGDDPQQVAVRLAALDAAAGDGTRPAGVVIQAATASFM